MFTDSHCHLFKECFDDIEEVIRSAQENQVLKYISAADSLKTCYEMIDLGKKYPTVYIALGVHPENCFENMEELRKVIEDNIHNDKLVAIGEIGLDYYYGKENKDKQIEIFEYQLELAEKYNLPVIVHSREATLDTMNILKKYKVKGVIHCFSGSLETAKEYIKMGYYIGIGGVMTFKKSKIVEIIKEISLESIILETDAPYLTPEPFRKYKNEPKYIKTIGEYLANLKNISLDEVSKTTESNIKKLFSI